MLGVSVGRIGRVGSVGAISRRDEVVIPPEDLPIYLDTINPTTLATSHMTGVSTFALDPGGTGMWISGLDLDTLDPPASIEPLAGKRAYRGIFGPQGVIARYDEPLWSVAYKLNNSTLIAAVQDYWDDWIATGAVGEDNLLAWGEHFFFQYVATRGGYTFIGEEAPYLAPDNDRSHHELRPVSPNWDVLWAIDATRTAAMINGMVKHVSGGLATTTGLFNRHADADEVSNELPFLEAGGVLIDTFTWYAAKMRELGTPNAAYDTVAKKIAEYIYTNRDGTTGLIQNQANSSGRWDFTNATSEIGWWATNMLRAYERTNDADYLNWAAAGVGAFVQYAWQASSARYYGRVNIATGLQVIDSTEYVPGAYSRPWDAFFPKHDYLIELGLACTELFAETADTDFQDAAYRIATIVMEQRPTAYMVDRAGVENESGYGLTTAESFGRAIRFLQRASVVFSDTNLLAQAKRVAHEAYVRLWHPTAGMFRGHAHMSENRYDAVDRTGVLLDAMLDLGSFEVVASPALLAYYPVISSSLADTINYAGINASDFAGGAGLTLITSVTGGPDGAGGSLNITNTSTQTTTLADAVAANDYITFTITPDSGKMLSLSHFLFSINRTTAAAPDYIALRSSLDGFTENLMHEHFQVLSTLFMQMCVSLNRDDFFELAAPIEFRFYFYGSAAGGTQSMRLNNLRVYGRVDDVGAPPADVTTFDSNTVRFDSNTLTFDEAA